MRTKSESNSAPDEASASATPTPPGTTMEAPDSENAPPPTAPAAAAAAGAAADTPPAAAADPPQDRLARFRALQARAKKSSDQNFKEATRESQRLAANPAQLASLSRRHATASHKLLRAEVEDAGGDFERKRAWDWTAEESERWDRRVRKREANRDDTAFRDYGTAGEKAYKKQVRALGPPPGLDRAARDRLAGVEKAASEGTLDIVEEADGELVAVDCDGRLLESTRGAADLASFKPDKVAVDRLVADLRKQEEASLKRRRDRMAANGDDADVTYINEKNKQFNQKLARFYNKYTAEIRESFERGTMI